MGTEIIILIHHTDCGMQAFDDADFRAQLEAETGVRPWDTEAFSDVEARVRKSVARIVASPFIPTAIRCAASSTRWRPACCARSRARPEAQAICAPGDSGRAGPSLTWRASRSPRRASGASTRMTGSM